MTKSTNWCVKASLLFVFVALLATMQASAVIPSHVLQATYIDFTNNLGTTIPAGTLTAIGNTMTVNCPGTSGSCTIQGDLLAQTVGGNTVGNNFEFCLYVDGNRVDPYCFGYAGVTPADGSVAVGLSSQTLSGLALGNHTVQTYFWSSKGCEVVYRHFTYSVYKP